jgi:hypothetical protein
VAHITSEFGKEKILSLLDFMKEGESVDSAVLKALSVTLDKLEKKWHDSLRQKTTWFTHLSYHLYEILFGLMALIAMVAFIKIILKKRSYMEDEPEDNPYS